MDDGRGRFSGLSASKYSELTKKDVTGLFREGEQIEVRGSKFEVIKIDTNGRLELQLIPNENLSDMFESEELKDAIGKREEKFKVRHKERNIFNKGKIH